MSSDSASSGDVVMPVVAIVAGFVIGVFSSRFTRHLIHGPKILFNTDDDTSEEESVSFHSKMQEEHKLVLCVRTDLKMTKGKMMAQVGHATLGAYKSAARRYPAALKQWEVNAQPKIALQIHSHKEAQLLQQRASQLGLVTYMVYDAGRTQIAAVSPWCSCVLYF